MLFRSAAKLDGKVATREEQLAMAKKLFLESLGDEAVIYNAVDVLSGRT